MKTTIHAMDFSLTESLEQFIRNQAKKSMRASSDMIEHVSVRLKDLNGPKGGCDKECSVEVFIPNSPSVVVTKRSTDAYACIRKALGRAARVTLRKISRKRSTAVNRKIRFQEYPTSNTGLSNGKKARFSHSGQLAVDQSVDDPSIDEQASSYRSEQEFHA